MPVRGRKHLDRKRKAAIAIEVKVPEDIEVQCYGKWLLLREGLSTALLADMQEGFATMPGNTANNISEAFKSAEANLEIS